MIMHTIRITLEGGVIQAIEGVPEDIRIEVWDFDCEEEPDEHFNNIFENPAGERFYLTVYNGDLATEFDAKQVPIPEADSDG